MEMHAPTYGSMSLEVALKPVITFISSFALVLCVISLHIFCSSPCGGTIVQILFALLWLYTLIHFFIEGLSNSSFVPHCISSVTAVHSTCPSLFLSLPRAVGDT